MAVLWDAVTRSVAEARGLVHDRRSGRSASEEWGSWSRTAAGGRWRRAVAQDPTGGQPGFGSGTLGLEIRRSSADCSRASLIGDSELSGRRLLFASFARHWTTDPAHPERKYDEQLYPLLPPSGLMAGPVSVRRRTPIRCVAASLGERTTQAPQDVSWVAFDAYRDGSSMAAGLAHVRRSGHGPRPTHANGIR